MVVMVRRLPASLRVVLTNHMRKLSRFLKAYCATCCSPRPCVLCCVVMCYVLCAVMCVVL